MLSLKERQAARQARRDAEQEEVKSTEALIADETQRRSAEFAENGAAAEATVNAVAQAAVKVAAANPFGTPKAATAKKTTAK